MPLEYVNEASQRPAIAQFIADDVEPRTNRAAPFLFKIAQRAFCPALDASSRPTLRGPPADEVAMRLEDAYDETKVLALTITDREAILRSLEDPRLGEGKEPELLVARRRARGDAAEARASDANSASGPMSFALALSGQCAKAGRRARRSINLAPGPLAPHSRPE